jgi:hypothetical protein
MWPRRALLAYGAEYFSRICRGGAVGTSTPDAGLHWAHVGEGASSDIRRVPRRAPGHRQTSPGGACGTPGTGSSGKGAHMHAECPQGFDCDSAGMEPSAASSSRRPWKTRDEDCQVGDRSCPTFVKKRRSMGVLPSRRRTAPRLPGGPPAFALGARAEASGLCPVEPVDFELGDRRLGNLSLLHRLPEA